jgi:hypothetical protein
MFAFLYLRGSLTYQSINLDCEEQTMTLRPENQTDKARFDKMKQTEKEHGRTQEAAIDIAAKEVKELRRREGRSRDEISKRS